MQKVLLAGQKRRINTQKKKFKMKFFRIYTFEYRDSEIIAF
jgi:hypothetical protein